MLIYTESQKYFARKYGVIIKYSIWSLSNFTFTSSPLKPLIKFKKIEFSFPVGIIIPLLVSILSTGRLYFAGILMNDIEPIKRYRIGRPVYLSDLETTKIRVAGPISLIILSTLLKLFNILDDLAFMSIIVALTNMIPLTGLDGFHILFTSRPIYVFTTIFILIAGILLNLISPILALILSFLLSVIWLFIFFYKYEPGTKV